MTEQSLVIRPESEHLDLIRDLKELWRYRQLVSALVVRDIRIRYRGSSFGFVWSLINPLLQILVTTVAVSYFLGAGPRNLSVYLMCAFIPWNYFQNVLLDVSALSLSYQLIMKKVYFPREIPVITACCSNAVQLLATTVIFIIYRWGIVGVLHGWPGWPPIQVLWLPIIMVLTFLFTLGVALIVTAYGFFYEDVRVLLILGLNGLYYLLPIIYFAENIFYSGRLSTTPFRSFLYHIYLLNPLAWLITAFKQVFFGVVVISAPGAPVTLSAPFDMRYFAASIVTTLVLLLLGYTIYSRLKWKFSERP
jgi:ABC-type polysaccharide/polyol phosphate export permease